MKITSSAATIGATPASLYSLLGMTGNPHFHAAWVRVQSNPYNSVNLAVGGPTSADVEVATGVTDGLGDQLEPKDSSTIPNADFEQIFVVAGAAAQRVQVLYQA